MPPSKKIAIIGAGAAGMSCASTLAKHPEFAVTLIDTQGYTGGQATSINLDASKHGASWLNEGVQGGSQIFRHTFQFFRRYGYEPQPVKLQVAFGKGKDFWTNVFPSHLVDQHSAEIKKLPRVLSCIKYLMPILGILPIKTILRLFRFSTDFSNKMVLPLLALFLGTGNQTPNVSSVLLERLFNDPQMKLWEYDPDTLLPNLPIMYTFPNLSNFYRDWTMDLERKGVDVRLNCHTSIVERGQTGVVLQLKDNNRDQARSTQSVERFDDMVMCCPADEAKKLLDRHATWREKYVLGGVKFYNDITITHSDAEYFQRIFEMQYDQGLPAAPISQTRKDRIAFAEQRPSSQKDGWLGFRPMYFTRSYGSDPGKIEMGFNCSHYQHQFREAMGQNQPPLPPDQQVFQTIFLVCPLSPRNQALTKTSIPRMTMKRIYGHGMTLMNRKSYRKLLNPTTVFTMPYRILTPYSQKWWHQFGHRWQHYLRVVPGMMFINGTNRTLYAGSWTMVVSSSFSIPFSKHILTC